ncbi:lysine-specific demethylase 4D-like [Sitodiplosis mosellana]|uniref:lysine-specific demethylase 4D-like n=1 Tax=Sitodiplosis mosellana TaxID=263140 RepID=UPI002443891D|nr:lysine-specific demethylase 4D-like [Sitodiplosis mosellana]
MEPNVLKPTEIKDVAEFIQNILESDELNAIGSVKIIPPDAVKFKPLKGNCTLPNVDRQTVQCLKKIDNKPALFEMEFEKLPAMKLDTFKNIDRKIAKNKPGNDEIDSMWNSLHRRATTKTDVDPVYATEWRENRFESNEPWNINSFTEKHSILNVNAISDRIPGIQSSYVIVGMYDTWFCAHKEDNDLASINILLEGEPKVWYILPPKEAEKFEKVFKDLLGDLHYRLCLTALRHKCFVIPPWVLKLNGIKYYKRYQRPGEIIITSYRAYHFGYNTGFNICEASNIASPKFLDIFANAVLCKPDCWLYQRTNATKEKLQKLLTEYKSRQLNPKRGEKKLLKQSYLLTEKEANSLKRSYKKKSNSENNKHKCTLCHSTFKRHANLVKHNRDFHEKFIKRNKCSECKFMAPDEHPVIVHQQKMHPSKANLTIEKIVVQNSKQQQKERLKNLLKIPKRQCQRKEKSCEICGKTVSGKYSLDRHMQNIHKVNENAKEM